MISIVKADKFSELAKHRKPWDLLLSSVPSGLPTNSYAWLSAYFNYSLQPGESWLCFFAYKDELLLGVLPLISQKKSIYIFGYKTYRLPMDNHTIAVYPLLSPSMTSIIFDSLLNAAWHEHPDTIWLEMPDTPENTISSSEINYIHTRNLYRVGRYLNVEKDQKDYQSSLSKNFRSNQRKASNKLNKLGHIETVFIKGIDASSKQLTELMTVETAGWKGHKGTAIQQSEVLVSLYTHLTNELATSGWLEWHIMYANGTAIAVNLAIRLNRSIVVWKLGYDESYSQCSPGGMLFQSLLDNAFNDPDIDEVNLLTDAEWYNNWKMEIRMFYNYRIYNPRQLRSLIFGYIPNKMIIILKKYLPNSFIIILKKCKKRPCK